MDLSIIIVSYNTRQLLQETLDSIYRSNIPMNYEILVSDNGSTDGSVEMVKESFKDVKIIENNANLGFAKANNIAIKRALGRYILLLNSDTVVKENCLDLCIDYMDKHLKTGALGCKVLLPDGRLDSACRRSFPTPEVSFYRMTGLSKLFPQSRRFGKYNLTYMDINNTYEVECIVGAFMLVRRETIKNVGLLDEEFFMYGEDVDWCYRIKADGWQIIYYSEAEIIHCKGGSSNKRNPKLIYEFYRAMLVFYQKHYINKYSLVTTGFVYMGIYIKLVLSLTINQLKGLTRRRS